MSDTSLPEAPADAHVGDVHGEAHGGGGHAFDFLALNRSHNYPWPAVEWIHGHPTLIFDLAEYAQVNLKTLEHDPGLAAADGAKHLDWATAYVHDEGLSVAPAQLAKAMTVAEGSATFVLPRNQILNGFNHQSFWSLTALTLMALCLLVFSRRKVDQLVPVNRFQHIIESLVLFVRDEIVRPNMHQHGPDHWTPFFAAIFLALLTCNVFGIIPLFGTSTGTIGFTAAWAGVIALLMLGLGIKENGLIGFWVSIVPVKWEWKPGSMVMFLGLFPLELLSLVSRPAILAVRLFANMFAGHIVLLVFASLGFVVFASQPGNTVMATGLGLFGGVLAFALYALELLVSVIQAYIFTLLSAVFIGMYMHPEH